MVLVTDKDFESDSSEMKIKAIQIALVAKLRTLPPADVFKTSPDLQKCNSDFEARAQSIRYVIEVELE